MSDGTATKDLMEQLHGQLAEDLINRIKSGDATASDLSVARQFLKDNDINCDGASSPKLKKLSDTLPDLGDNVTPIYGG